MRSTPSDPNWPEQVKKATGGKGVDLIVDMVSAGVANHNLEAAEMLGRIVNVGRLGGMKGEFNFDLHALKRIDYIGVTFRTRTADEVREIDRLMRADLWPAVEAGKLSLPIYKTYPLDGSPTRFRRCAPTSISARSSSPSAADRHGAARDHSGTASWNLV